LWKERERRKRKKIIQKGRRWVVGKERWEERKNIIDMYE
jgi:hypothetical protein